MNRKYTKDLILLACTLATVGSANASWWSDTWNNYAYATEGSWVENWVSSDNHKTWNDVVYSEQPFSCPKTPQTCTQSIKKDISAQWSDVTSIGQIMDFSKTPPNQWTNAIAHSFSDPQNKIFTIDLKVAIAGGQSAQLQSYVKRRYGWTTMRGYAYYNGQQGDTMKGYLTVHKVHQWGYDWDGNGNVGMLNGYKMQDDQVYFRVKVW